MNAFGRSFALAAALAVVPFHAVRAAETGRPLIEPWGYPLEAIDRSVKPGDDFFRFANGRWLERTVIAADRSAAGFSIDMSDRNEQRMAEVIASLDTADAMPGTEAQKIRDLHASFMDTTTIERLGLAPIRSDLARIARLATHVDVARAMTDPALGLSGPFHLSVETDAKAPTHYVVYAGHDGLSLPDKTFYLRADERIVAIREAFARHVAAMLALAGIDAGAAKASDVLAIEHRIAALHWDLAQRRDAVLTYNAMTLAELAAFAPGYPWREALAARGLGAATTIVVQEKSAFPALAKLFADTPISAWRSYLTYQLLAANAAYLPKALDEEHFSFYGRTLNGQKQQRARDKRAIAVNSQLLDQAVGRVYVERYLPPQSKQLMTDLFENIRAALKSRIEQLAWMTPPTRRAALEKLAKLNAKIAYPDKWRDYSGVAISPKDLFGNVKRARIDDAALDARHLREPVDRQEWFIGPQIVNAFYDPNRNEAFIPAGYMQSPLFDPFADPAINYGAIGSIIGHEIGHGFDDQGAESDADGMLRDWWTDADRKAFDALGNRFTAQFDQYEYLPKMFVNGRATLGENIGDLAGVVVAYHAYQLSLKGTEAPVLDGFTGTQRVFLGRAQARRLKRTEESERQQLLSDVHSPMPLRVNGIVRNVDEWYEAFAVKPGDKLYLAPADRVRIW